MNSFITLDDIITATQGNCLSTVDLQFESIGTDTRKSLNGQLFVALQGESHDAHNYLEQAVQAGAAGVLIHRWDEKLTHLKSKTTVILVNDTLIALQKLGHYRRQQWGKPIIAVTGSNGKTTTKEFIAQIISPFKKVHFNQGSFNNHWGLPLTLLGLKPEHEVAICEMGMNHPGEITALVRLAQPNVVGVTMVGRAHFEGLGSLEAVAAAKAEIYQFHEPKPHNIEQRIFNLDNKWTKAMFDACSISDKKSTLTFSSQISSPAISVHFKINKMSLEGLEISGSILKVKSSVRVPVFGKQNLDNLMFAACAALVVGLTPEQIWQSLSLCKTIWGRNQRLKHPSGAEFLFDAYNANPDSQKALIENLKLLKIDRPLIGIFGEMRELGKESAALHEELGALVATAPFNKVFFVGNYADSFKAGFEKNSLSNTNNGNLLTFADINDHLIQVLQDLLSDKPLVTVKGSRGVALEKILKGLSLL